MCFNNEIKKSSYHIFQNGGHSNYLIANIDGINFNVIKFEFNK